MNNKLLVAAAGVLVVGAVAVGGTSLSGHLTKGSSGGTMKGTNAAAPVAVYPKTMHCKNFNCTDGSAPRCIQDTVVNNATEERVYVSDCNGATALTTCDNNSTPSGGCISGVEVNPF